MARRKGAFFFGAAAAIGIVLDRIAQAHRAMLIDPEAVPFLDSTAARTIEGLAHRAQRRGTRIVPTGASGDVRRDLTTHGVKPSLVAYARNIPAALEDLRGRERQTRERGP